MKTRILFFVFLLFIFFSPAQTNAQTANSTYREIVGEIQLPYPGILPTHPLYFFKNLRDKISGLTISDPGKKIEFNILQAEKHLNAGVYLFAQGDQVRAVSSLKNSIDYYDKTVQTIVKVNKQGFSIKDRKEGINSSIKKEETVLIKMRDKSRDPVKKDLNNHLGKIKNLQNKLRDLFN